MIPFHAHIPLVLKALTAYTHHTIDRCGLEAARGCPTFAQIGPLMRDPIAS